MRIWARESSIPGAAKIDALGVKAAAMRGRIILSAARAARRRDQLRDKHICHAERGAEKAGKFLKKNGFGEEFALRVAECVRLGFTDILLPRQNLKRLRPIDGVRMTGVDTLMQASDPRFQ